MLKIGTPVRLEDGTTGIIDKTSIRTGMKLYRVNGEFGERWMAKAGLERA